MENKCQTLWKAAKVRNRFKIQKEKLTTDKTQFC